MTSNDIPQYVTVEILRSELGDLRAEVRSGFEKNNNEFDFSEYEVHDEEEASEIAAEQFSEADDKNISHMTEEQNLLAEEEQDEEFISVVNDIGMPNINDWEEV